MIRGKEMIHFGGTPISLKEKNGGGGRASHGGEIRNTTGEEQRGYFAHYVIRVPCFLSPTTSLDFKMDQIPNWCKLAGLKGSKRICTS